MFTGIIEDLGIAVNIKRQEIHIRTKLSGTEIGDSVSVNGVCLTVRTMHKGILVMDVSGETFKRTNIGELKPGDKINIERAVTAEKRMGGHFVTGHIEGTGKILYMKPSGGKSLLIGFSYPETMKKYIVSKGSVAVDGISLTVVEAGDNSFSVSIIPHTFGNTTLGIKKPGSTVNLEPDILAKYMENIINPAAAPKTTRGRSKITKKYLSERGF